MKLKITIDKKGPDWFWTVHQKGKLLATSRSYPRVGPLLRNLHMVMGIKVNRHLRIYETPIKEDGTWLIWGRIQPPLVLEQFVRR